MKKQGSKRLVIYLVLLAWGFICIYPMLWMIGASLKEPLDVMSSYALFPTKKWLWETYYNVWNRLGFFKYFLNSLSVTVWTLVLINLIYSFTGFAFAKLKFPGKTIFFYMFLGMMFVPGITVLVPIYLTENYLGILDTHLGVILPMVNGGAPFAIFLFRNYFQTIPHEIYESAKMEGAGISRILFQIYLPLALPAIITITTMNFLGSWNSLVLPMIVLNDHKLFTLPLAVMLLDTGVFRQWNVLMAGSLISIVPVVITFFSLQKYYLQGLAAGAVKS
ncbi:sugar ABC transporter permease [Paenibacillus baekrokdamisoli]|uniref:Sugar ABC transporter permease n=1 Tax=Paenibacillus baekrokdamisoli TaxID=1712516 RepID=A0A3G9IXS9_9BACL|nr:carbohydrate ABC transporter permease [Paenibacillus baekrokdamisoli]MBB3068844.1 ABC-type glycerol-3-phosphate transport system permease component [Paenibacillus baekrokdamisoli]BBH23670.1 sugar ABC transporter permease [Paenibacillus baekrokdamisoli]